MDLAGDPVLLLECPYCGVERKGDLVFLRAYKVGE